MIEADVLTSYIKEVQQHFADFSPQSKEANTVLIDNLLASLEHFTISKKREKDKDKGKDKDIQTPTAKQRR